MKKIKFIILILIVFLFAGCSGDYNLKFNRDLSIDEDIDILIDNKDNAYENTFMLFEKADIDADKYDIMLKGDKVRIIYKEKYKSFEDYYLNSKLYRLLFKELELSRTNSGMFINTESNFKLDDSNNQNIINSYDIDDLKINITMPFNVIENNADEVKDDTYTWVLNKNNTYKNIRARYDYENDRVPSIVLMVVIGVISFGIIIYLAVYFLRNRKI
jgi:hypothetical protein